MTYTLTITNLIWYPEYSQLFAKVLDQWFTAKETSRDMNQKELEVIRVMKVRGYLDLKHNSGFQYHFEAQLCNRWNQYKVLKNRGGTEIEKRRFPIMDIAHGVGIMPFGVTSQSVTCRHNLFSRREE